MKGNAAFARIWFSLSKSLLTDAGEGYSEAKRSRPDAEVETNVSLPVQPQLKAKAVGVRNPLEASLSSSRRHQDRQVRKCHNLIDFVLLPTLNFLLLSQKRDRSFNTSRESSVSRKSTNFDPSAFDSAATSRATSVNNTPRHSIALDDDGEDVTMLLDAKSISNTSTPFAGNSGRTTPCTDVRPLFSFAHRKSMF